MEIYLGNQKINSAYIGNQSIARVPNLALQVDIDYVVAAGGGGGGRGGAGGGAGGLVTGSFSIKQAEFKTTYTVTVGQGGASGSIVSPRGGNGGNSFFGTASVIEVTAIGGGGGAGVGGDISLTSGSNGGSGGGSTRQTTGSIGFGTVGQGNNGGRNGNTGSLSAGRLNFQNGGGGGASTSGSNGISVYDDILGLWFGYGGNGGQGTTINWNPLNSGRLCDGGGAGENYYQTAFAARAITGSRGGITATNGAQFPATASSAPANGGGGAGGGADGGVSSVTNGGNGGSGLVLVRYFGGQIAEGGQISTSGSYTIHTFTSSGNFII
jgi:hypothetical protein